MNEPTHVKIQTFHSKELDLWGICAVSIPGNHAIGGTLVKFESEQAAKDTAQIEALEHGWIIESWETVNRTQEYSNGV